MIKSPVQKAVAENPFYGMRQTLDMAVQLPKLGDNASQAVVNQYLDRAWTEASSKEKRELFFVLLFSIGDIQNREHNIFRKKGMKNVDGGGNSSRKTFQYILNWMLSKQPAQFYKLLPIIGEYYNLDGMMFYEIKTDRFKGNVKEIQKLNVDMDRVTDHIAAVLRNPKTSENEKKLWAKWLWHIPTAKRQRKFVVTEIGLKSVRKKYGSEYKVGDVVKSTRNKQTQTQAKDTWTLNNIHMLSVKMGWEIVDHPKNKEYKGYKEFKKKYLADSEATMFSSQKIKELDKQELLNWFDQLPSGARFRTQTRLLEKDGQKLKSRTKWISNKGFNIGDVFQEWMLMKEVAQQNLRNLTKEDKEKLAKDNPSELKKMEKAAKVNVGGETLIDTIAEFFTPGASVKEVNLKADAILNKMNLQVPVLGVADISGSMSSNSVKHKEVRFTAISMARLIITMFLLKNPDEDLKDMFIRFNNSAEVITAKQKVQASGHNRFMSTSEKVVDKLVDSKEDFITNFNRISQYLTTSGGTDFNSVARGLKNWVDASINEGEKSQKIEWINKYPVILVASDGDINSHSNAAQSVAAFQQSMKQWFGWQGVVVIWDVKESSYGDTNKFEGLENVIYYSGINSSIVNSIFKNIHDLDIIDVYTPLKSLYLSNRYEPVRELIV